MPTGDWLRFAIPLAAAAGALALLLALRSVSRQWAPHWSRLRAQPGWLRWFAALAVVWIALRLARAGWRPLLAFAVLLLVAAGLAELAARARR